MAMLRDWRERRFLVRQERSWRRTIVAMAARLGEGDPAVLLGRANQVVDRLAVLITSASDRFPSLDQEQKAQAISVARLDEVIDGGADPPDWLDDRVEIRRIGHSLHAEGGVEWMVAVAERVHTIRGVSLRQVEMYWHNIGDWRY
ncbi:hypothetical protein LUW76_36090 [Actinomadura madurae]|uniref:hypothetical protein n=1 Tax=Actinomadura madurae TaxID=1993 RepID=UPI002026D1FE|nr:hypothetical protein [Actinomadura madurae]URM99316.1 hypothetical protein LUW76_36090 [Actinomadura madurae]